MIDPAIISNTPGTLYIVATPIGNREDISLRALSTLKLVDAILAEDTRNSMQLLSSLGIKKPMISLHAHNEHEKSTQLIAMLRQGKSLALISDAGTPLINDPGFILVRMARAESLTVVPIPGACALIAALSAAGIACDTFSFGGFLPAKSAARRTKLAEMQALSHTLIFYESTHRILASIDDVAHVFGMKCELLLVKELTKIFERFVSGDYIKIKTWLLADSNHIKCEFVLIIPARTSILPDAEHKRILQLLLAELPLKSAVKLASQLTTLNKNELYQLALALTKA